MALQTLEFIRDHEHHDEYVQGSGYDEAHEEYWHHEEHHETAQEEGPGEDPQPAAASSAEAAQEADCGDGDLAEASYMRCSRISRISRRDADLPGRDGDLAEPSRARDRRVSAAAARSWEEEGEEEGDEAVAELSSPLPRPSSAGGRRISRRWSSYRKCFGLLPARRRTYC